jgi:hypothetical protein
MGVLPLGRPSTPFGDIGWYGSDTSTYLIDQAINLASRKLCAEIVNQYTQVHGFLPYQKITM